MTSVYSILLLTAFVLVQLFIGGGDGTRLIYVLPSYVLLGLTGMLTLTSLTRTKTRLDRACLVTVLLVAIYFLVRMAKSPVASLAWVDCFSLLGSLLVYFITAYFITGTAHRIAIVIILLVMAVGQVGVGLFQFAKDPNFSPLVTGGRGDTGLRASGLFICPNHLAGFVEVVMIFGVSLFFWGGFKVWAKVLIAYLTLVCLGGLVLSGSRGGYLSAGAGVAVFSILSVWTARSALSRRVLPRLIGIAAVVAILAAILASLTDQNFSLRSRTSSVFVSKDIRLQLWEAAIKQFQLSPAFGTGSRTYLYYGRMFRSPGVQTDPVFAHNDYLQTLAEYGIAGVVLILGFVAAHLRRSWRSWQRMVGHFSRGTPLSRERNELALQLGAVGAIVAMMVHSVTDFNLHIPANALLMAFVFGIVPTRGARREEERLDWRGRWPHFLPASLGVAMLAAGAPSLPGELVGEIARAEMVGGNTAGGLAAAERALKWRVRSPDLFYYIGEGRRLLAPTLRSPQERFAAIGAAHEAYAEGLALFPQDVRLLLITAWSLDKLDCFEDAESLYAKAIELDPNSGIVWAYYGWHYEYIGLPVEALAHYRKAARLGCDIAAKLRVLGEKFDLAEVEKQAAAESPKPSKPD